jgi:acyl carrier protein
MKTNIKDEIEFRVRTLIAQSIDKAPHEISMDMRIEDLSRDSIQLFEIIMLFEREFATKVMYEDLVQIEYVRDIVDYVECVLRGK